MFPRILASRIPNKGWCKINTVLTPPKHANLLTQDSFVDFFLQKLWPNAASFSCAERAHVAIKHYQQVYVFLFASAEREANREKGGGGEGKGEGGGEGPSLANDCHNLQWKWKCQHSAPSVTVTRET